MSTKLITNRDFSEYTDEVNSYLEAMGVECYSSQGIENYQVHWAYLKGVSTVNLAKRIFSGKLTK